MALLLEPSRAEVKPVFCMEPECSEFVMTSCYTTNDKGHLISLKPCTDCLEKIRSTTSLPHNYRYSDPERFNCSTSLPHNHGKTKTIEAGIRY